MPISYTPELIARLKQVTQGLPRPEGVRAVRKLLKIAERTSRAVYSRYVAASVPPHQQPPAVKINERDGKLDTEVKMHKVSKIEDVVALCQVDPAKWETRGFSVSQNRSGEFVWRASFKPGAVGRTYVEDLKADLKADLRGYAPKATKIKRAVVKGGRLLEIAAFDLHLGKLGWSPEVGADYDIKIARSIYFAAIQEIVEKALKQGPISKILFPCGNDYLTIDSDSGETTAGTKQDVDSRFSKIYREGRQILVEAIEYLRQFAPVDVVIIVGNHDCYSSDTEILTRNGFKHYLDLKEDDKIATLNTSTLTMEFQGYTNLFAKDYSGEMIEIKNRYADLLITPKHRLLSRLPQDDGYGYSEAESTNFDSGRYFRLSAKNLNSEYPLADDWYRLFAWINTDGSVKYRENTSYITYLLYQVESKSHLNEPSPPQAAGYRRTGAQRPDTSGAHPSSGQAPRNHCAQIEEVLQRLGIGFTKQKRKRTIKSICGKDLIKQENTHVTYTLTFKSMGFDAYQILYTHLKDKYVIPEIVFSSSARQMRIYLSSYVDGDGTRKEQLDNWATIYGVPKILNQVQQLITMSGGYGKLNCYRGKNWRVYYQIEKENTTITKDDVKRSQYDGKVWCLTVQNGNFVTRRNGTVNIQGNCVSMFHLGDALECWFHAYDDVKVNNLPISRKYYQFGKNMICYCHGHQEKHSQLPQLAAVEQPEMWAATTTREWHTAHRHHEVLKEHMGVNVRTLSSLSGPDKYHHDHAYVGAKRMAQGFLFNEITGLEAIFQSTPVTA